MRTCIVWFKNDLRLQDNETLAKAIAENDLVIPVYCFDDTHFTTTTFGFKKTGSYRATFLLQSVQDLNNNLRAIGSGLIIAKGNPAIEICKLAEMHNVQQVYTANEIAPEEVATIKIVENALKTIHIQLKMFATSTLYTATDLPFTINNLPDIFTNFRIKVEASCQVRPIVAVPNKINSPTIPALQLPSLQELGVENKTIDCRAALQFIGGETEAHIRLQHYFYETQAISQYKETRNGLIGSNYSSKFSAWLANGCISPVSIYYALQKYEAEFGANQSTYWLVFELLWRDYFYFVMQKYGEQLFLKKGIKHKELDTTFDNIKFDKWKNGKTGVDFVDANMLELQQTGFMSNRGRQNVASYLCNDLKLDWRYGAAYFEQQLIDYDVCSNWGNWAYIAGVGNDPRPNRYFNIAKQANDYDSNSSYRKLWLDK